MRITTMKMIDYRERLGLGMNDLWKTNILKNKLSIKLKTLADTSSSLQTYEKWVNALNDFFYTIGHADASHLDDRFIVDIISTDDMRAIIYSFVAFANSFCKFFTSKNDQELVYNILYKALDELNIQYELIEDKDGIFVFPKGAKELDEALVSEPLEWLKKYPVSRKAFEKALKDYSEQSEDNYSDVADKFRKALETFFQEFFDENSTLENLKSKYGTYLKEKGVPKEISGNFETLLQAYTNYMNNYAKHRDKTSKNVLEYIMYQTGNIIRLLITLKEEEKSYAD